MVGVKSLPNMGQPDLWRDLLRIWCEVATLAASHRCHRKRGTYASWTAMFCGSCDCGRHGFRGFLRSADLSVCQWHGGDGWDNVRDRRLAKA